jgi:hypothetical protein
MCTVCIDHQAIAIVDVLDDIFSETNERLAQTTYKSTAELEADGVRYYPNNTIHDIKSKTPPPPTISQIALAMIKYNYAAVPHVHEPIDLLMLEAYLTRYDNIGYMNYYMSTQPKFVYRLSGADIASVRQDGLEQNYKDFYKEKMVEDLDQLHVSGCTVLVRACCAVLCCAVLCLVQCFDILYGCVLWCVDLHRCSNMDEYLLLYPRL